MVQRAPYGSYGDSPNPAPVPSKRRVILSNVVELLLKKNAVYGSENIIHTGVTGVLVRMVDKGYRAFTIIGHNPENNFESLQDTIMDIIGYSLIGMCLLEGKWGKSGPELEQYLRSLVDTVEVDSPISSKVINRTISDIKTQIMNVYNEYPHFDKVIRYKHIIEKHFRWTIIQAISVLEALE